MWNIKKYIGKYYTIIDGYY